MRRLGGHGTEAVENGIFGCSPLNSKNTNTMNRIISFFTSLCLVSSIVQAQSPDAQREQLAQDRQGRYPKRAVQIGFVSPISTNGLDAGKVSNRLSLNALGSYAAALDGAEFSGLVNVEKDYVDGVQFAGIVNAVGHEVDGAQFAGIANVVGGPVYGAQFAGISNVVRQSVKGTQIAGISNLAGGRVQGAQIAGIVNVGRDVTGVQIAGIINAAKQVKGSQIGLINVADNIDGPQIGLISLARTGGYRRLEVWASDVLLGNVALKMGGNRQFYNIFAVGANWPSAGTRWGYGYGIGTNMPLGKRLQLSVEAMSYQIHEEATSWDKLNMLNQARVSFIVPVYKRVAITVTPTFNVQVSQQENRERTAIGPKWSNRTIYDQLVDNRTRVRMWPGINVGMQF